MGCTAGEQLPWQQQTFQLRSRKVKQFAVSGERDVRLLLMINPAVENSFSDGPEVAEMHMYFRASITSFGKHELLSFQ